MRAVVELTCQQKKTKKRKYKSTNKPIRVADGGRVTSFKNGGAVMTKTNQKPHMS